MPSASPRDSRALPAWCGRRRLAGRARAPQWRRARDGPPRRRRSRRNHRARRVRRTKTGSFVVSPAWKRTFSSNMTSPSRILRRWRHVPAAPTQSGTKATSRPSAWGEDDGPTAPASSSPRTHLSGVRNARAGMTLAALLRQFADGRHDARDSGRIGDGAVHHRHVEIDAHQTPSCRRPARSSSVRTSGAVAPPVIRALCPSPRRYRPCGWRSPTRCRTRTGRGRRYRRSP